MDGVNFAALFDAKRKGETSKSDRPPKAAKTAAAAAAPAAAPPLSSSAKRREKKKQKKQNQQDAQRGGAVATTDDVSTAANGAVGVGGGSGGKLAKKMAAQLAGAQFRYINEQLYTRPSAEAVQLFAEEPELFEVYHEGFRSQAANWPMKPVQFIATWLRKQPAAHVVADLGCGDAELSTSVPQTVHSFDLVAVNDRVVACDIADVPLAASSVHVCVFCLALMGSNYAKFLKEAHRLLRPKGTLKIAEVASRIEDVEGWDALLRAIGFDETERDDSNTHFTLFTYVKSERPQQKKLPRVWLKPCIYKRR